MLMEPNAAGLGAHFLCVSLSQIPKRRVLLYGHSDTEQISAVALD
jgi:hypothetical protein